MKQSNIYPRADITSDHSLVFAKVQIRLRELQVAKQQPSYQLRKLHKDVNVKKEFQLKVLNRFEKLQVFEAEGIEENWGVFEEALSTSAEETIPKVKPKRKQKWMIESIFDMIEERGRVKGKDAS